jgi:hypothetical protein
MLSVLSEKSQAIVLQREQGVTLAAIGEQFGVSHQRVSAIVRDATELVTRVELDLMVARKTGEVCAYLIPYGPNYTLAMDFSAWLVRQLRRRDIELTVSTRRASNGLALVIEDVTDYQRRGER